MLQFELTEFLLLAQQTVNQPRDLFVAVVAIGLGLNIVYTAICNSDRCFQLSTVQMMERNFGRQNARVILVCLGSFCVVLGIYLAAQASFRRSISENLSVDQKLQGRQEVQPASTL